MILDSEDMETGDGSVLCLLLVFRSNPEDAFSFWGIVII